VGTCACATKNKLPNDSSQVRETKASQLRQTANKKRLDETVEVISTSASEDTSLTGQYIINFADLNRFGDTYRDKTACLPATVFRSVLAMF
jgi:hypothetical protein